MIFVYNFLQALLLPAALPLLLIIICRKKYRTRIGSRLGLGLKEKTASLRRCVGRTIWIHALSVGEVTSAVPLVKGIRAEMDACIVFSAATQTGMEIARDKIGPSADLVISAPFDLLPVINWFLRCIRPDLFILVETDFWPNWLNRVHQHNIPLVLVNGRISSSSFARYKRFHPFFHPLFSSFSLLAMQTGNDAEQMRRLGIPAEKITTLGNLKYDTGLLRDNFSTQPAGVPDPRIPKNCLIWVCGSTHPGEEDLLLTTFTALSNARRKLFLILAPRDPGRGGEIETLAAAKGLKSMRRTNSEAPVAPILILDTIGELAECYPQARAAFIGGSIVALGGHNPLEAAVFGVPVLFGPHMEDFSEIAGDLVRCGGAVTIDSAPSLEKVMREILDDEDVHQRMSSAARHLVEHNAGVVNRHIRELRLLLSA